MTAARFSDPMLPRAYRVRDLRPETSDTFTIELSAEESGPVAFAPGQFNMLYAFGVGEAAISLSGSTGFDAYVHTVREVGAVSRAIAGLSEGAEIGVRGPFGTAWPVAEAEGADVVFVAGGLGLAPLRPAILHVLANRKSYGRVVILFGSRDNAEILFRSELEAWRQRLDVDVGVTVDHADLDWHGNVGVVTELITRAAFDPSDTVAMVCGPEVMMRFSVAALRDAGVASDRIYVSMERNMKCAIGLCGHCQFGPDFICKDGPVMTYDAIGRLLTVREI